MMLLIRSRSTVCIVLVDRQQVLALARPALDPPQRRRRRGVRRAQLRRLALDEALADQLLRAHEAGRVAPEVLVGRVVDAQHERGLEVRRDLDGLDLADLDAGDACTSSPGITKPALSKIARTR